MLEVNRPLLMPDPGSTHPVEVGVFERLASISLPQQDPNTTYQEFQIPLPPSEGSSSSSSSSRVKLRVKPAPYSDRAVDEISLSGSLYGSASREADDVDRLVDWFQDMVTTLLRDQPADPIGVLLAELRRRKQETAAQLSTLLREDGTTSNCPTTSGSQSSTAVPGGGAGSDVEVLPTVPMLQQQLQDLHNEQLRQQQQQQLQRQQQQQQQQQPFADNCLPQQNPTATTTTTTTAPYSQPQFQNSNSQSFGSNPSAPELLPQPRCFEMAPDALAPKPKPKIPHQPPPGKVGRGALGLGLAKGSRPRDAALGQVSTATPAPATAQANMDQDADALLQQIVDQQPKVQRSNSQLAARWSVSLILKGSACQAALEESLREQARLEASKTLAKSVIGGVCGKLLREAAGPGLSRSPSRADRKFSFVGRPSLSINDTADNANEDQQGLPTPIVSLGIDRNSWGQWLSR